MATTSDRSKLLHDAELPALTREMKSLMRRRLPHAKALAEIDEQRDRLIREMHAAGMGPTQLGELTGLSTQRVDQIRRGSRL